MSPAIRKNERYMEFRPRVKSRTQCVLSLLSSSSSL